jgi:hypothetical protein
MQEAAAEYGEDCIETFNLKTNEILSSDKMKLKSTRCAEGDFDVLGDNNSTMAIFCGSPHI